MAQLVTIVHVFLHHMDRIIFDKKQKQKQNITLKGNYKQELTRMAI